MSLDALSAARKITSIPSRDKFVLMALADYAQDTKDYTAEVRQSTLAEWTCMSRQTINAALYDLEHKHQLIRSEQLYRDDNGMRSKAYRLVFMTAAAGGGGVNQVDRGGVDEGDRGGVNEVDRGVSTTTTPPVNAVDSNNRSYNRLKEQKSYTAADAAVQSPPTLQGGDSGKSAPVKRGPRRSREFSDEDRARARRAMDVWNGARGPLPEASELNDARIYAVQRKSRELSEARFFALLPLAVANVARDPWWQGQNERGSPYAFDNLLTGNKIVERSDSERHRRDQKAAEPDAQFESEKDYREGLE